MVETGVVACFTGFVQDQHVTHTGSPSHAASAGVCKYRLKIQILPNLVISCSCPGHEQLPGCVRVVS